MQSTPVAPLTRLPPGAVAAAAALAAATASATPPSLALAAVGDALDVGGSEDGLLRGHGTMALHAPEEEGGGDGHAAADLPAAAGLVATLTGAIARVDRLVSVRPLANGRYGADLGDVVVGRVVEVGGKRWRLDLGGRAEAALLLGGAGALPGGASSRKKTSADEAAMRALFAEGDLLAAEVQALHADGSVIVHTRAKKYGRLAGGQVVCVPPPCVRRSARQFNALPAVGVDVILGVNGWVWVAPAGTVAGLADGGGGGGGGGAPFGAILGEEEDEEGGGGGDDDDAMDADGTPIADPYPPPPPPSAAQRAAVARVAAAVRALGACGAVVDPGAIEAAVCAADAGRVATAAMDSDPVFLKGLVGG